MIELKRFKVMFFDREVAKAVARGRRKGLSQGGLFVQRAAKRLLSRKAIRRRRGKVVEIRASKPGEPPMMRTGLLRRFVLYGYDQNTGTVVVGPAKLPRGTDAPRVLEHGGRSRIEVRRRRKLRVGDWGPIRAGAGEAVRGIPGAMAVRVKLTTVAMADRANEIRAELEGQTRSVRIAKRPYMLPAFEKVKHSLAPQFRDAIHGGA